MNRTKHFVLLAVLVIQTTIGLGFGPPASAQRRSAGVNEQEVDRLLSRLELHWSQFRRGVDSDFNRNRSSDLSSQLSAFEEAERRLRERSREGRESANDVRDLLRQAGSIESSLRDRRSIGVVSQRWNLVRSDLDSLARYYNVAWRWDNYAGGGRQDDQNNPRGPGIGGPNVLTGTYRLDPSGSDDVEAVVRRSTRSLPTDQQERLRQVITRRLQSPEALAIERRGRQITMASTRAAQVTFEADGRTRVEQTPRGRTVRVSATVLGDQLIISQTGERGNDYSVTFDPVENGRRLRVMRRIDVDGLAQPLTVNSTYEKTAEIAQMDLYKDVASPVPSPGGSSFPLRAGSQVIARLNDRLSTSQSRQGDRFTMTVQSPPEYAGAIIEGNVSNAQRSGRVTGRSEVALNFERIRLRNGTTYNFDGYIESVRTPNGENVRVDNEGNVAENNTQTSRTVTRGGIGAALGALIGAVAGGVKGAAIGAAVGAGAGAGSVFIEGRDDLDLVSGTEFTIRVNAPRYREEPGA